MGDIKNSTLENFFVAIETLCALLKGHLYQWIQVIE